MKTMEEFKEEMSKDGLAAEGNTSTWYIVCAILELRDSLDKVKSSIDSIGGEKYC